MADLDQTKEFKTFKVLTIDGGGIKGLYSAQILKHFEEKFDCRISDYFDMLCGTSTGGLIALALSLKISAAEICEFYDKQGPKIFPKFRNISFLGKTYSNGTVKQLARGGKFTDTKLKTALVDIFGEKRIADSNNLLCITSVHLKETE